ncbi:MAG: DsrE family protein [Candidatus Hodarchaeales archaeon]
MRDNILITNKINSNKHGRKVILVKILVHITHGPEHPTRAALGFHVAKAAIEEGHEVTIFLAGDAVQLMRDGAIDHVKGLGTGDLRELYNVIVANGTKFYLSGKSSKARGLTESELKGKNYEFAYPKQLVQLAVANDRMFNY